jgi:hypothetical protein
MNSLFDALTSVLLDKLFFYCYLGSGKTVISVFHPMEVNMV